MFQFFQDFYLTYIGFILIDNLFVSSYDFRRIYNIYPTE